MADKDDHDFPNEALLRRSLHELEELRKNPDFVRAEEKIEEVFAHLRDSKIDLEDIFDLETMLREADPKRRAQKLREALNNPELDKALEEARAAGVPGLGEPVRDSPPSPWARARPKLVSIDRAALPSASVTTVRVPVTTPNAEQPSPEQVSRNRPSWPAVKTWGGALLAVFGPLFLMYVLFVRPSRDVRGAEHKTAGSLRATAPTESSSTSSSQLLQSANTAPAVTASGAVEQEAATPTSSASSTGAHPQPERLQVGGSPPRVATEARHLDYAGNPDQHP
jgi:hypothetical protein